MSILITERRQNTFTMLHPALEITGYRANQILLRRLRETCEGRFTCFIAHHFTGFLFQFTLSGVQRLLVQPAAPLGLAKPSSSTGSAPIARFLKCTTRRLDHPLSVSEIQRLSCTGLEDNVFIYPFTAPSWIPRTRNLCDTTNRITSGMMFITLADMMRLVCLP